VQEHCGEDILDEACLFKFGWYIGKVIAMYVKYNKYGKKGCYIEKNKKQGVISDGVYIKKGRWKK